MRELERHLASLKIRGLIDIWDDSQITPGEEWEPRIKAHLEKAQIILLLISADFLHSGYCYDLELTKAIERHKAGNACVIPVILRDCNWEQVPVGNMLLRDLQALPEDATPINQWIDRDEVLTSIAKELEKKIQQLQKEQERQNQTPPRLPNADIKVLEHQTGETIRASSHPELPTPPPPKRRAPILRSTKQRLTPEADLTSEKSGISYHKLRDLLTQRHWKAADQETAERMLEVMGRQSEGWLREEDIEQFPCKDLKIIDRLWVNASDGKFGFSIQQKIWRECDNPARYNPDWEKFGECLGWRRNGVWIYYDNVTFDTSTCQGHLPISGIVRARSGHPGARGCGWALFSRIETCQL